MLVVIISVFFVCIILYFVNLFVLVFLWSWSVLFICVFCDVILFIIVFMFYFWSVVNFCICLICIKIYCSSLGRILLFREMNKDSR